jgi:hypothetical protein
MKGLAVGEIIPEATGMTVQGFRKELANETLKVKDLEAITQALGLQMDYWWQDNNGQTKAAKVYQEELIQLKKRIARDELTIDHLNDQIVELKKRLEEIQGLAAS